MRFDLRPALHSPRRASPAPCLSPPLSPFGKSKALRRPDCSLAGFGLRWRIRQTMELLRRANAPCFSPRSVCLFKLCLSREQRPRRLQTLKTSSVKPAPSLRFEIFGWAKMSSGIHRIMCLFFGTFPIKRSCLLKNMNLLRARGSWLV